MNVGSWLLWGFVATVVLTILMAGSEALRLTRMSIPYMLGTMFTPKRDRARIYGIALHLVNGWAFSSLYVAGFHASGQFNPAFGALVGLVHAAFVLAVGLPALPGLHPRMAGVTTGPTVTRQLQPPGFLGRHYGGRTPLSIMAAHLVFGAILGGFYTPS